MFVSASTDFLARADRLDLDSVREQDDRRFPDAARKLAEVLPQGCVSLELGLDVPEEALGLLGAVREDDLVMLIGIRRRVDAVLKSKRR